MGDNIRMKSEITSMPKDLIPFKKLKYYVDKTREEGLPMFKEKGFEE
jgi:hypothetical protein